MDHATYQQMRELEDRHWWFTGRRKIIRELLTRLALPKGAQILELGCGTGGNMAMLSQFGSLSCVEQDDQAIHLARDRKIADVKQGSLPDSLPEFPVKFDLIALFDVIEHVEDDLASLHAMTRLLAPGGRIIITVPAFGFLWSQHDDENQHFRRYRKRDLRALAMHCKMKMDFISYFNFWLFPAVAVIRLVRKVLPYEESWKDMRMPAPWVNSLLASLFAGEKHLMSKVSLPWGISLAAVISHDRDHDKDY
jgi:SAM-dependent methyltransferase